MSAAWITWPTVTAVGLPPVTSVSVPNPGAGSAVIVTASSVWAPPSVASEKPKSAALNEWASSSLITMVSLAPAGASFTGVTETLAVDTLLAWLAPWPSSTWKLMVRVRPDGASLVLE